MLIRRLVPTLALAAVLGAPVAHAEDDKGAARTKYLEGVAFVQKAQWSDALAAFEASSRLYPNPSTTLNMGACERALGRYVRARATLSRALAESAAAGNSLPESSVSEARGFLAEIDRILAKVSVTVDPPEAAIAVDGRPLAPQNMRQEAPQKAFGKPVLAAGVLPPGPGKPPPAKSFDLILDPGAHVITLSRKGFTDAVVNRSFAPGSASTLDLKLDLLPATLHITASQPAALVRVGEADVGPAPVDVLRPAGAYKVVVEKRGFVPYAAEVSVQPGEQVKLSAELAAEKPSVVKKWWFWTSIVVGAGGIATVAILVTRPKPEPPPYDGGSANWVVKPTASLFRF
jgi:hypothetical protein